MTDWKTMESAPKDGETAVLGYQKIHSGLWVIAPMYYKDGEWLMVQFHSDNIEYPMQPTHWQTISSPPKE